ncbi:MAG: hypothetical protein HY660_16430 [Armatimonadetes bacterium]|nr:hypothetical protein [Armatimonadota bacterium]
MNLLSRIFRQCPVTSSVIAANAVTFLVTFVGGGAVWRPLIFRTWALWAEPWSAFTYPVVAGGGVLGVLLGGYVLWLFGGSLERGWGRRDYVLFLLLTAGGTAFALWMGSVALGRGAVLAGLWMPVAAATVAWAVINPHERLLLYLVIPLEARWMGVIAAALVFFSFPFPLGLFALSGCGIAWWYARTGRYVLSWSPGSGLGFRRRPRQRAGMRFTLNPIEMIRRWRRKRHFLRLMKQSGLRDLDS